MDRYGSIRSVGNSGNCKSFGMAEGKAFVGAAKGEAGEGTQESDHEGQKKR